MCYTTFTTAFVCLLSVKVRGARIILRPPSRITFRLRIANKMAMDSCCRGGIVNIRFGFPRARSIRPESSTALWRFRASTSNSPSGLLWLPIHTHLRYVDQIYAQQDIRVCEDDHFQSPNRQLSNPKALCLIRVSI